MKHAVRCHLLLLEQSEGCLDGLETASRYSSWGMHKVNVITN